MISSRLQEQEVCPSRRMRVTGANMITGRIDAIFFIVTSTPSAGAWYVLGIMA